MNSATSADLRSPADPAIEGCVEAFSWRLDELPPLPQSLTAVLRALQDDEIPVDSYLKLIEADPAISMRLVRLANAPLYGHSGRIASVGAAMRLLGLRAVAGLLMAIVLRDWAMSSNGSEAIKSLLVHMNAVAAVSRRLAQRLRMQADEAYLAGLLHDVGLLLVLHCAGDRESQVTARLSAAQDGARHAAISREVMLQWGMPAHLAEAVGRHYADFALTEAPALWSALALANHIAELAQRSADDIAQQIQNCVWPTWFDPRELPGYIELARENTGLP